MRYLDLPVNVTASGTPVSVRGLTNIWVEVSGTSLSTGSIQGNIGQANPRSSGSGVWQTLSTFTTNATGSIFRLGSDLGFTPAMAFLRFNMSGQVISGTLQVTIAGQEESR